MLSRAFGDRLIAEFKEFTRSTHKSVLWFAPMTELIHTAAATTLRTDRPPSDGEEENPEGVESDEIHVHFRHAAELRR